MCSQVVFAILSADSRIVQTCWVISSTLLAITFLGIHSRSGCRGTCTKDKASLWGVVMVLLAALLFWDVQFSGSERRCWNHFLMDSSSIGAVCVRWLKSWLVLYLKACSVCCTTQKVTLLFDAVGLNVSGCWCSCHFFLSLLFPADWHLIPQHPPYCCS